MKPGNYDFMKINTECKYFLSIKFRMIFKWLNVRFTIVIQFMTVLMVSLMSTLI